MILLSTSRLTSSPPSHADAEDLKIDGEWRDHILTSLINPADRKLSKKLIE